MKKIVLVLVLFLISLISSAQWVDSSIDSTFYGLEIEGERVLLILDRSGSMTGSRHADLQAQVDTILTYLEAKAQKSSKPVTVTFITFDNACTIYPERKPITMKTKSLVRKARAEIKPLIQPRGGTDFIVPWTAALKIIPKQKIDVVYFMTDGGAASPVELINTWKNDKKNKKCIFKIKCISVGGPSPVLKEMADNIGDTTYTEVRDVP